MSLPWSAELERALVTASEELGLKEYYRDNVRPILGTPRAAWPRCCGGDCEPCAQTLGAVAGRVHELLGIED
jgi:hypothetical protein